MNETTKEAEAVALDATEHEDSQNVDGEQASDSDGQADGGQGGADQGAVETVVQTGIAKPPLWKGSTAMDEIDRRQATRKRIAMETARMSPPVLGDMESIKEYAKDFRKKNEEYLDACYLIDYDLDRYKRAFKIACEVVAKHENPEEWIATNEAIQKICHEIFAIADAEVPLSAAERDKLEAKRQKEEEKRKAEEKAKRDPNEVEGQMKLDLKTKVKGDDGSCAEAASEVVTYKEGEAPPEVLSPDADDDYFAEGDAVVDKMIEAMVGGESEPLSEAEQKEWDAIAKSNSEAADKLSEEMKKAKASRKRRNWGEPKTEAAAQ